MDFSSLFILLLLLFFFFFLLPPLVDDFSFFPPFFLLPLHLLSRFFFSFMFFLWTRCDDRFFKKKKNRSDSSPISSLLLFFSRCDDRFSKKKSICFLSIFSPIYSFLSSFLFGHDDCFFQKKKNQSASSPCSLPFLLYFPVFFFPKAMAIFSKKKKKTRLYVISLSPIYQRNFADILPNFFVFMCTCAPISIYPQYFNAQPIYRLYIVDNSDISINRLLVLDFISRPADTRYIDDISNIFVLACIATM